MSLSVRQPFQLYFPLTCLAVFIALLPWWLLWLSPVNFNLPLHFHSIGMINLVGGAAFTGFLFTALPEWTGQQLNWRIHLPLLVFLLLLLATQLITPQIAAFIAIVYWGYLLILCTLLMWRAKNWRHQSFLWLMLIILVLNAYYFAYPAGTVLWQIVDIMIASISIANFRIARAIGNQALDDAQDERRFIPHPIYKNLTIITMILLVISQFYYGLTIQAYLALAVGFAFLARLNDWHNIIFLRCHYIRAHYVITLLIALGYLFLGMSLLSHNAYIQAARHLIAIGGMLAMIYLTISIAGLRHSHLKLKFHWYTRLGLVLIFIAALSRSIGVVIFPSTLNLIILPTVLITLSFLCYLSVYLPIFLIKK